MSICICPSTTPDEQSKLIESFIQYLKEHNYDWTLLNLQDMCKGWDDIEEFKTNIATVLPFRGGQCTRTFKCCSQCTRKCATRCIQDCMTRVYMWRRYPVKNKALEYIIATVESADDLATISYAVGDFISRNSNPLLAEYMDKQGLRHEENPYKMDYAPQFEYKTDPTSGRRSKIPIKATNTFKILHWPQTGLCPFCLPSNMMFRRKYK